MKHDDELPLGTGDALDARLRRLHRDIEPSDAFDAALAQRIAAERATIARAQAARVADRERLERDLSTRLRRLRREAWVDAGVWIAGGTAAGAGAWQLAPAVSGALATTATGVPLAGTLELAWAFGAAVLVAGGWVARQLATRA